MNANVAELERPKSDFDFSGTPVSTSALVLDTSVINAINAVAEIMAGGKSTIPKHLQGNCSDCFAVTMQSMQWGMNPFAVAQKTHLVSGTLGYEAQLVNAVIIARAPVTGRMNYEWFGDWDRIAGRFKEVPARNNPDERRIVRDWPIEDEKGLGISVWATFKGEVEPRELRLLLSQAGTRNSPLWGQDPKQQLAYLAVKRWSRLYCPDVILGVYTPDELEERTRDMGRAEEVPPPASESRTASVRSKLASKRTAATPPSADSIIANIAAATNQQELAHAIEPVAKVTNDADKERIRAAYGAKVKTEKERTQREAASDVKTGQEAPAESTEQDDAPLTYAQIADRIEHAQTLDALDEAADLIGSINVAKQREELVAMFQAKQDELNGAK